MIGGLKDTFPTRTRTEGFLEEIKKNELTTRDEWIIYTSYNEEGGYRAMSRLLKSGDLPTAIFCHSDMIAIGAIKAINDAGYSVPDDISVIGFDDVEISTYINPGLTTVRQDSYSMGNQAANLLKTMMENPDAGAEPIVLPVELVIRESCKKI